MSTPEFDLTAAVTAAVKAAEKAITHHRCGDYPADALGIGEARAAIEAALPHLIAEKDAEIERLRGVVAVGLDAVTAMDEGLINAGLLEPGTESKDAAMIRAALVGSHTVCEGLRCCSQR